MSQVRISRRAAADELEIWLHISRQSPQAADRIFAALQHNYRTLAKFPGLGESCAELEPRLRHLPVDNYVIFYRPVEGGIEVVRVVHGARDVQSLFGHGHD